jgi:hypothetical protein
MTPDELAVASNRDALKQVIQAGMFGLGLGASGRALLGLKDMFTRTPYTPPKVGLRPSVVEINLPQEQEEEEQRRLRKTAEGPVFSAVSDYLNTPSNYSVINWLKGLKPTGDLLAMPSLSPGAPLSKPWFMPSVVGAATLGTLGGYKAVGAGLDTMEDQRRKNELEDAKREYRNALVEQYNADKRASDNPATLLDNVADKFIKQAGWGELVGAGTGAYLTLAGLLASGAGYGTYNWVKSRSPENRLAKAIKQRERLRWATRPPEIYAVTKPMAPGQTTALEEEDQEVKDEDQANARRAPTLPKLASEVARLYRS